jgi:bifunctional non-homologous end joining protein LigD
MGSATAFAPGTRVHEITAVVGGWTEPSGSRPFFKGLLLGIEDEDGQLRYVGHATAGFNDAEIGRVWKRLHALKTRTCPFTTVPRTSDPAHWVKPTLSLRVRFTGWTADGRLRHPTYEGLTAA